MYDAKCKIYDNNRLPCDKIWQQMSFRWFGNKHWLLPSKHTIVFQNINATMHKTMNYLPQPWGTATNHLYRISRQANRSKLHSMDGYQQQVNSIPWEAIHIGNHKSVAFSPVYQLRQHSLSQNYCGQLYRNQRPTILVQKWWLNIFRESLVYIR